MTFPKLPHICPHICLSSLPINKRAVLGDNINKKEFRIFNEANNSQFETLINGENWEEICADMNAQSQYEKFDEIYMRHYNNAYPLNHDKRTRRKNERKNPKPWILPWLENACARKKNYTINSFMLLQPKIKPSMIK